MGNEVLKNAFIAQTILGFFTVVISVFSILVLGLKSLNIGFSLLIAIIFGFFAIIGLIIYR